MDKKCLICGKTYKSYNKNSKFCGVECQHKSYRNPKVKRISSNCLNCGVEFHIKENDIELGRGKYCGRECKDVHQKNLYQGENNPMYGKKHSEETRKKKSEITKKLWENNEYKQKIKESKIVFLNKNGFWPGCDDESINKRKITNIERYGVSHIWEGVYGERKCDKTTVLKYGKSSVDILTDYEFHYGKHTDIEVIFKNLLDELGIEYQSKFRIYNESKTPFWYKEFDFLINNTNFLIEVDGDFWHGNKETLKEINKFHKETQEKDRIKQNFAEQMGYEVIRFWGSDIKKNIESVVNKLLEKLNKNE